MNDGSLRLPPRSYVRTNLSSTRMSLCCVLLSERPEQNVLPAGEERTWKPSFRSPPSCGGVSSPRSRHLVVTQTLTKRQQFRKWWLSKLCSYIHRFVIQSGLSRTWWDKACCTFPVWLLEALIGRIFIDPFVLTGSSPWLCFQALMKCGLSVTVTKRRPPSGKNQVLCCFRATPGKET